MNTYQVPKVKIIIPILIMICTCSFFIHCQQLPFLNKQFAKYLAQGKDAFYKKDYKTAIKGFKEIIRKDQTFHRAYMKIVDAYLGLKKPEEGIEFFRNLIKGNPSQAYSYLGLGYIYEKTKQYKKAIKEYKKVIELNPDINEAYYGFVDSSFRVKGKKEKQRMLRQRDSSNLS